MVNEIIELLPSAELKAKIKETNYQFRENELLQMIYRYATSFDTRIDLLERFSSIAASDVSALAKTYIKYERENFLRFNIILRIDVCTVIRDTEMQVGTRRAAGSTHITDDLTGIHILTRLDDIVSHVHINGAVAITVIDAHIPAGAAFLVRSNRHLTGPGSINGRTGIRCHINALMHGLLAGNRMLAHTKLTGDPEILGRCDPGHTVDSVGHKLADRLCGSRRRRGLGGGLGGGRRGRHSRRCSSRLGRCGGRHGSRQPLL